MKVIAAIIRTHTSFLFVLLLAAPSSVGAATLYSQIDHSRLVYTAPASYQDAGYWGALHLPVSATGQPLYWWINARLPQEDTVLWFSAPNTAPSCVIRFEQQLVAGWIRAYAVPDCTTSSGTRADLPTFSASSTLRVAPLGSIGQGGELYGGALAAGQSCPDDANGTDACAGPPALLVTDDPNAVPEPLIPLPYNDTATHLTGTYYQGYRFAHAGSPYVIDGPVYIRSGDVTLEPGVVVKFRNHVSNLIIHPETTFTNLATAEDPVYFTSYKDDAHGGDTNGDGSATVPAPGDWGHVDLPCSSQQHATADNTHVLYGGSVADGIGAALYLCASGGVYETFSFNNLEVAHSTGGLVLVIGGGSTGVVNNSSFHDNTNFGVRVEIPRFQWGNATFVNNWWGSPNGPQSSDNPGGDGDVVQGNFPTVPFLTEDPFAVRPPAAAAPTVTNLAQFREFGIDPIESGAGFIGNAVVLKAEVSDADSTQVTLEVELKRAEEPFDGTNTHATTSAIAAGATTTLSVDVSDLIPLPTQYAGDMQQGFHWRARAVDSEGHASEWVEYESIDHIDFVSKLTIGYAASLLARAVVTYPYLIGARGWDYDQKYYVESGRVASGYAVAKRQTGSGLDCSGLVEWSYNRYFDPTVNFDKSYVPRATANDQYRYLTTPVTEAELRPGDLLFFDWDSDSNVDHVAVYAGGARTSNVVHASGEGVGIVTTSLDAMMLPDLVGFGRPYKRIAAITARTHSPVHLSVTDPEGFTVSDTKTIVTAEEIIRSDGDLLFAIADYDAAGYPEYVAYSYTAKPGTYKIDVTPYEGASPDKTYSLEFTAGSSTVWIAKDVPLSDIPADGFEVVVDEDRNVTVVTDTTPPEARIRFDKTTKKITITGTDNTSSATVSTTATSSTITDEAGNTLSLTLANNVTKSQYTSLSIPVIVYSTGTTTNSATTLRYFWATDKKGKYTLLISAVRTPTERRISVYVPLINKTYILDATASDDTADLSKETARLLLRKKVKTYTGMVLPVVTTDQGRVLLKYE
jgi:cell wall-associated NlpC family hydrolase